MTQTTGKVSGWGRGRVATNHNTLGLKSGEDFSLELGGEAPLQSHNFHDFMIALCLSNSYVTVEEEVEIVGENEFDNIVVGEDVEIFDDGTWMNPQVSLSV